jgi:glycosyltransferase involved in cell wall biosynthesis
MRIVVNAVSAAIGGGGTHIVAQLDALARMDDVELAVHATGAIADRLDRSTGRLTVRRRAAAALWRRLLWEQLVFPWEARRHDVIYNPGNFATLLAPRPQVVTIQNAWYFTDSVRAFRRARCSRRMRARLVIESAVVRLSFRRASRVVAVSHTMRNAVEEDLGPQTNMTVVLSAPPKLPEAEPEQGGVEPYVFVAAHDDPHKDWDGLVRAWAMHPDLPRLRIAGRVSDARRGALRRMLSNLGADDRVEILGTVAERGRLATLFRSAECYVAHSYFESFGLTACEAMLVGTPVAASDIPAHREVCGPAASYYRVDDPVALASAVRSAIGSPPQTTPRAITGRTWATNAAELLDTLRRAAGG